ncbi:ricin-type beta-trefoil lectin domain protein [Bradyrhizobium ontarionense]|uniref:Ricin-type beta-trefoil lectin domain protein n=1 Tax=Bradyrhizobium ontarionense TaxID=2898149 RepID=A0ABY3RJ63_9BRAD|nr:ricin-type beta-trefoil lectin domain protein [Bradyrhizobium sp. A19]UFZ07127.1 ricin-type beta-trefoil lectin domain protein [Bradyrhizobium sp. A19]
MTLRSLAGAIALGCAGLLASPLHAANGTFNTLSYNVAETPTAYNGGSNAHSRVISCYLRQFGIANVQEDFLWHAALYDTCDNHPYRTPTSGTAGIGDGLNTLSTYWFDDLDRVTWTQRADSDALTPKGFSLVRTRLAEGVYLDFYNLHAQSGTSSTDLADSESDVAQILSYIEANSAGNAVMVMGDTNTRYTRAGQNMWEFLHHGFSDAWIEAVRGGAVPPIGDALVCGSVQTARPDCEIVDKVLWRNNGFLNLQATSYVDRQDALDPTGAQLSDHHPIEVDWSFSTAANRRMSDQFGGPHGTSYNDVSALPANPVVSKLTIRTGNRVDQVELTLSNGYVFSHGGSGGTAQSLPLGGGEYLTSVSLCSAEYQGHTRIFSIAFSTSAGRTLSGGATTSSCTSYAAPSGWQIAGFHGRSGDEMDKLGVVYAPVSTTAAPARQPVRIVNRTSALCMDVNGGTMADGTAVIQWYCNGSANQTWSYDDASGMIRSMQDPHYCLDNNGTYGDGAQLIIWTCTGNNNQRFRYDATAGTIALRSYAVEVVSQNGTSVGNQLLTSTGSAAGSQLWSLTP